MSAAPTSNSNFSAPHTGDGFPYFGLFFQKGEREFFTAAKTHADLSHFMKENKLDLSDLANVEFIDSNDVANEVLSDVVTRALSNNSQKRLFGDEASFSGFRDNLFSLNNGEEFGVRCVIAKRHLSGLQKTELDLDDIFDFAYEPSIVLLKSEAENQSTHLREMIDDEKNAVFNIDGSEDFIGGIVIGGLNDQQQEKAPSKSGGPAAQR